MNALFSTLYFQPTCLESDLFERKEEKVEAE